MAKKKIKSIVSLFDEYSPQIDLLSFDQAGMLFALIRKSDSIYNPDFSFFESSLPLSDGCRMIWAFIKADLAAYWDKQRKLSAANAANARKRWGTTTPAADQVPDGQKSIIFSVSPAAAGSSSSDSAPDLIPHIPGMRSHQSASKTDATGCDRISPIYNNNNNFNNTDNNVRVKEANLKNVSTPPVPDIEQIKSFFLANGATAEAAMDYFSYYAKRDWKCGDGKPIFDFARSVRLWVQRNAEYQKKQTERQKAAASSTGSAAKKQRTGNAEKHAAKKAGAQFHYFDQRKYNFDELLKDLYPDQEVTAVSDSAADEQNCQTGYHTDSKFGFRQRTYDYDSLLDQISASRRKAG